MSEIDRERSLRAAERELLLEVIERCSGPAPWMVLTAAIRSQTADSDERP
jgi:hypothetical protein